MIDKRRVNDLGTSTSDVVVESARDRIRTSNVEANAQVSIPIGDVMLPSGQGDHVTIPHVNCSISGYEPDSLRTPSMRSPSMQAQEASTIPQSDGPGSLPMRDPIGRQMHGASRAVEQDSSKGDTYVQRASPARRREYTGEDGDNDGSRRPHRDQRPPDRGRCPNQGGRPDLGGYPDGGPPGDGGHPRPPGRQGPPGHQGPPGPVRPIIVQTHQVMLDTSALENTFDSIGQSMLQLDSAQDQTNRQLQQHIQQGQANMQAHTGALQQLATSSYQRNFDHIFASIPIYERSDREGFFP